MSRQSRRSCSSCWSERSQWSRRSPWGHGSCRSEGGAGFLAGLAGAIGLLLAIAAPAGAELFGMRSQELQDGWESPIEGFAFAHDAFGQVLAVGDFNCDGRDDLAVFDNESITDQEEGAVHVLYSDASGLPGTNQIWKDFLPLTGDNDRELFDSFGRALAAGNFDGNSFMGRPCDDLAIGIPGEDLGGFTDNGAVLVLYGFPISGLSSSSSPGSWRWVMGADGLNGGGQIGQQFGFALAAGDFNNDGRDDLAIGAPFSDESGGDSGKVLVMYGTTASGLAASNNRLFSQDSTGADGTMQDSSEEGDNFGYALASGDFNGDGFDDLAIGVPGEDLGGVTAPGAVQVLYGFPTNGLRLTNNQAWNESNIDTAGTLELNDNFGFSLAAGDVTGEGTEDLVIGAPYEDIDGFEDAGAVTLLWGQFGVGLSPAGSERYDQSDLGDGESPGVFENFGYSLAIGDFAEANAVGALDLAIGIVQEKVQEPGGSDWTAAGAVTIVPGGFGLVPSQAILWAQGYRGSAGADTLNVGQLYGHAIATGDFNGDGNDDLAIGAPSVNGLTSPGNTAVDAGAVYTLYGALFADGLETGDTTLWPLVSP